MNLELRKSRTELGHADLTDQVIGAAIRVHRELGPGFIESIYEEALCIELAESGVEFERQKALPIRYRGHFIGEHRLEFLIQNCLILELKAISELLKVHFATVRSYMKASSLQDALLLNFAAMPLTVKRVGCERDSQLQPNLRA